MFLSVFARGSVKTLIECEEWRWWA